MTILIDIIPSRARKYVYALFALVGLIIGCLSVAGSDVTTWFNVYTFIGVALNLTAYANTNGGSSGDR